jgi:hypothetical protein
VFWGSCVVFWCSFWVGFWLSESLRGVFTPARNGRLQGSPRFARGTAHGARSVPPARRGNPKEADKSIMVQHGVSEAGAIFPAHACGQRGLLPSPPLSPSPARRAREGRTAVRPYTPLPPCGRGAEVRATKNAHPLHAANSTDVPLSASRRGSSISLASNFLQVRQVFLELLCRVVKGNTALA